jgi:hypothetical protein
MGKWLMLHLNPIFQRFGFVVLDTAFVEQELAQIFGLCDALQERLAPGEKIFWNNKAKRIEVHSIQ